ncbi:putative bifunctional diguanylate cyclase/phosphodiesterase [Marinomonas ostreistagni]|uniref:putative bifunctional diguanylate cyclase/phosphodiesterase n=1 Tax=Marinomonas ostreistagni TaxID=359209 RepID=UPI00194F0D09|nr:EAL domain-containing protein [Marinomonas ostreistagni]MBM6549534.1 EAL domain-containing protein [Marinomonas ostreistagni]
MTTAWNKSLFLKQALATIGLALVLSLALSGLKAYDTLGHEPQRIRAEFNQVLTLVEQPLAQALFRYDQASAQQQASSLLYHPAIERVLILDENQTFFAQAKAATELAKIDEDWVSELLPSELSVSRQLAFPGRDAALGFVVLELDESYLAMQILRQNGQLLIQNLVKDVLLACLLSLLFYVLITRPVKQLTQAISKVDETQNVQMPNVFSRWHSHDELGHLQAEFSQMWRRMNGALEDLDHSHQHAKAMIKHAADGILVLNSELTIMVANEAVEVLLNRSAQALKGQHITALNHPDFWQVFEQNLQTLALDKVMTLETSFEGAQQRVPVEIRTTKYSVHDQVETVLLIRDLSERKEAQNRINRLSFYDSLTHLPNRTLVTEQLQKTIARLDGATSGALILLDLDRFKTINDALGHNIGDQLLVKLVDDLLPLVPPNTTFARIGGDEFVFLWEQVRGKAEEHNVAIANFIQRVLYECSKVKEVAGHELHVTASLGISFFDRQAESPDEVLRQADTALYQAKAMGRNTFVFFQQDMQRMSDARLRIERALHRALEQQEFEVYYQPQLDSFGHLIGAEALLRWHSQELGAVSPVEFIPVAEDIGLISEISNWVMYQAMQQVMQWSQAGLWQDSWRISINVSPVQFSQQDLVHDVESALAKTGLPATLLDLEITENMLMSNIDMAISKMTQIRRLGVSLSVDDFGTGYSSLRYLKDLPIDRLKIDQSFIRELSADNNSETIVRAVIAMGHALHLNVLAEGVETLAHFERLNAMGCYTYQGFYFSRPISAQGFTNYCRKQTQLV